MIYIFKKISSPILYVSKPIYTLPKYLLGFNTLIKKKIIPDLLYHSQKALKGSLSEFWVVEETYIPSEAKTNSLEQSMCCIMNMDYDTNVGEHVFDLVW